MHAKRNALREALEAGQFVVAPGCYDALSARMAEVHGFGCVYMSGLAVTASLLGRPDLELLGMAEMTRQAELIVSAVNIPVIADADTGYGGLSNVERTTRAFQQAGVAAIHLEDQASPKRCGQTSGVRLIEADAMVAKLRVAVETRGDDSLLIIGRTDAFRVDGVAEAIRRANLYAETGVDLLFVDGVSLPEDFRRVRDGVQGRLVGSIVEVNAPANTRAEDLQAMGYSVAIHPISSILATAGALDRLMAGLQKSGHTADSFEAMMSYGALNSVLGIESYHTMWNRFSVS
ncbi:MAG: isocitrate lyase/PEP mutase family protein [Pirellulaceae bacterium]|jgi:2-methylisocitrate lyase-like PEP mutase family enzyme|nr:isocitrate lyase/PEP mutase family protein [Pirellulaceae bacterium]MCU0980837.1 isocitrate lyase/PEP mutase family protein [Pirellulaceae bacterium]